MPEYVIQCRYGESMWDDFEFYFSPEMAQSRLIYWLSQPMGRWGFRLLRREIIEQVMA